MGISIKRACGKGEEIMVATWKTKFISKLYINQIIRDAPTWSSINVAVKEIIFKAKPFKNKKKENNSNQILEAKK